MSMRENRATTASSSAGEDLWNTSLVASPLPRPGVETVGQAFLTLGLFLAGTGSKSLAPASSATGHAAAITWTVEPLKSPKQYRALSAAEQIVAIRSLLGLNISELAQALAVQRPTIYSWQSGTAYPHPENAHRLSGLYGLAQRWRRICLEPVGDWVRLPLDDRGTTLAQLLGSATVDELAVEAAFLSLKVKIQADSTEFVGVRDRARRRGYAERTESQKAASLDRETVV